MRWIRRIFNTIIIGLGFRPFSRSQDIPKKLSAEALASVMTEARFLRTQHGVEVKVLDPGEVPGLPKPADGRLFP